MDKRLSLRFRDQDGRGTETLAGPGRQVADGAGAEHKDFFVHDFGKPVRGVSADRDGLDHGALFEAHPFGKLDDQSGIHGDEFPGRALGLAADDLQRVADVVISVTTGIAGSAGQLGHDRDLVADGHIFNTFAEFGDFAGKLVPLDNGTQDIRMLAVVGVDIGAADPDPADTNQDLAGIGDGLRNFTENDGFGFFGNGFQHHDLL